ncbi:hypothetical protein GGF46_000497 [Coemansia sp. RSA 552]|nr:hypothetical protein GGF46_000497 [Coemansia sp. RSA 552]
MSQESQEPVSVTLVKYESGLGEPGIMPPKLSGLVEVKTSDDKRSAQVRKESFNGDTGKQSVQEGKLEDSGVQKILSLVDELKALPAMDKQGGDVFGANTVVLVRRGRNVVWGYNPSSGCVRSPDDEEASQLSVSSDHKKQFASILSRIYKTSEEGLTAAGAANDGPGAADGRPDAASQGDEDLGGEDMTAAAVERFEPIDKNIFVRVSTDVSKYDESIPCHCRYNPDRDERWRACGEGSDCINRLVQMECNPLTCPCGSHCLNRRFQKRQYAKVRIVNAGRKGFGMQALEDLDTGSFVMEYMGEVVTAAEFRKRTRVYQAEGIQHHYFMSIGNSKVIDATRKGCIARFVNHSCGPNCVLQKWMVGGAIRMGIFAERPIRRGEELTFDYKFERMADSEPQPCYCGSPECKGVIGVAKERGARTVENEADEDVDIDIDVADIDEEIADSTVTRHQRDDIRRRHAAVDDEEYGESASDTSGSDEDGGLGINTARIRRRKTGLTSPEQVLKFVQIMHRSSRQTRIIGILIGKLMETSDRRLLKSLIGLQGMGILRAWLQDYIDDDDDVMMIKILQCIAHMPVSTRNTIDESRLDEAVKPLRDYSDENVSSLARTLVERWSKLRLVFKIPKKSRKESGATTPAPSARHSPGQAQAPSTTPTLQPSGSMARSQSRIRSASPAAAHEDIAAHGRGMGWSRWGGFRGNSPGHPSYPGYKRQRYPHDNISRSRSPQGLRGPAQPGFGRVASESGASPAGSLSTPYSRGYSGSPSGQAQSPYSTPPLQHHSRNVQQRGRGRQSNWNDYGSRRNAGPESDHEKRGFYGGGSHAEGSHYSSAAEPTAGPAGSDATVSSDAVQLAAGWRTAYTKDGTAYYYHETTKETRWEPPLAEAQPSSSNGPSGHRAPHAGGGAPGAVNGYMPHSRLDRGHSTVDSAAPAQSADPRSGTSRVDDIVDRAKRLGMKSSSTTLSVGDGKPGALQLVTPDTDGEPGAGSGSALPSQAQGSGAASTQPSRKPSASSSGSGTRRASPDSGQQEPPAAKREKQEKKALSELATFVVKVMSKYRSQVGHDDFKREARKITKILMEKERKGGTFDPQRLIDMGQHKKTKIKQFVAGYMDKFMVRQARPPDQTNGA